MSTFDAVDHYFSGQGVVMMGARNAAGNAKALYAVGNCSAVKMTVATTTLEHKESHTGARGLDLRLSTEIKATLAITMENYIAKNLAQALRGDYTTFTAGTTTALAIRGYRGGVTSLGKMLVSNVVIKRNAVAMTAYTTATAPYDYKVNTDAGSVQFNDGSVVAVVTMPATAVAVTAGTVGTTTALTVAHTAAVGDIVDLAGFTGADASYLNGKTATIVTVTGTTAITVNIDTTGKTITFTTGTVTFDGANLTADFSYAAQYFTDSLTQGITDIFVRFEGLNTADGNEPVVVEVFRFSTDPLKDLDLISDGIQQFVMDGSVLADSTRTEGSKYFSVQTVR